MESKVGSILLLISGILTILISLIPLIFIVLLIVSPGSVSSPGDQSPMVGAFILLAIFIVLLIFGILKLWAFKLMKSSETTSKGGVVALIVGILNGGDLISIVGGILGIVQGGKQAQQP